MKEVLCSAPFPTGSLALAVLVLGMSIGPSVRGQDTKKPEDNCCYTNPGYQGVCKVTPAESETCASILAYLNAPNSTGKTYCDNTKIRGGWSQVPCEEEDHTASCPVD